MDCAEMKIPHRTLRTQPGKLLLGPAGARLMADYLTAAPGFEGRMDVIHKMNIPLLFRVDASAYTAMTADPQSVWYPDRLEMIWKNDRYALTEWKWITWDDRAVSWQRWENLSDQPIVLRLILPDGAQMQEGAAQWLWNPHAAIHGVAPIFGMASSVPWKDNEIVLAPHTRLDLLMYAACVLAGEEELLKERMQPLSDGASLAGRQRQEADAWFARTPGFSSSSPMLDKAWQYRWYILRNCLAQPDCGFFHHRVMYEGRSHKVVKTPWQPSGWEFTKLVPLSTPLHIMDLAWSRNTDDVHEIIRSLVDSADEEGMWRCLYADERLSDYANCSAYGLYRLYLREGDRAFIREVLPAFKRNCMAVYQRYKGHNDHLQVEYVHQHTGKEYQPSYWYFAPQYPDVVNRITEAYTPLKRVDRSVYAYLDFAALSHLCGAVGDASGETFAALAEAIRKDILDKMWDEETHFFYDLHHLDDRKAMVKNVVGFYPYWAGITDERHLQGLAYAWDDRFFTAGSGFASTAMDCPVFSACGGWKGHFFKGRNGCTWNGPSWPYTNAIVLDALAVQSCRHEHRYDAVFARFLKEYLLQHFKGGDIAQPYLVEHYDSITGEMISDEPDYNHSYLLDLVVRCVAGVQPADEGVVFDPIDCGLEHFRMTGIPIRGHSIDVEMKNGLYTLCADGEMRFQDKMRGMCVIPLD